MKQILVLGANGQLGQAFLEVSKSFETFQFHFKSSKALDILEPIPLEVFFKSNSIDFVLNCAAYTNVDGAESDEKRAYEVNEKAVEHLAKLAKKYQFGLIHFSTDYVFDGQSEVPYLETDTTNPINVYGASKLAGEQAILKIAPSNSLIIRTSWLYGKSGKNFVKTILEKASSTEELQVVNDQIGVLTNAEVLAEAVLTILPKIKNVTPETYHYSEEGLSSWCDIAVEICDITHQNCEIKPVSSEYYKTAAKRPKFSKLDSTKLKEDFEVQIPNWKESLKAYVGR